MEKQCSFGMMFGWDIQTRRNLVDWEVEQWLQLISLLNSSSLSLVEGDCWIWLGTAPPRVETFVWQLAHHRVAVKEELLERGVTGVEDSVCFVQEVNEVIFQQGKVDSALLFFITRFRIASWFGTSFKDVHIPFDSLMGDLKLADLNDGAMVKGWDKGGIGGLIRDGSGSVLGEFSEKSEHDALEKKFSRERAALEATYQKLYEPLYTKRYEIVNGRAKVEGETNAAVIDKEGDGSVEGVPDFWLTAMKMNEVLAEEITEQDKGALKYLKDIKWSRIDDPKGFKLEFFFDSNPYFKNSVLTKTYHMVDDENDPILEKAIGMKIEWYTGKCLTQKVLKKKPKKGSKNAKSITKTENCGSFLNFFNPPQIPDDDGDIDDDLAEELQDRMEHDCNIGRVYDVSFSASYNYLENAFFCYYLTRVLFLVSVASVSSEIRDKLIPHVVSWFTGEAVQGNEYDALEGDFDSDNEDDDENEDGREDEMRKMREKIIRAKRRVEVQMPAKVSALESVSNSSILDTILVA
ncbi:Nucleosome assembly protein 1 [Hibiscus syriacus]|uniref:Nucleosome assembly protein 1 n=1 Tax=Hibiscus syriacus TaxID=106335 RepID=A0A6A2WHG5_HIBSY|nr:Nucleosome assembly protein 1 [Hibiscus syriacus]